MDEPHVKDMNPEDMSDAVRCLICLNTYSGQPVASPQHCHHFYCLACITEWAKTTNTCPVDRLNFTILYQRSSVESGIQKIITVEPCDAQESDEEDRSEELSVCEECGRSDHRHLMLLCSACDSRFHISCLSPPLPAVPSEDWFCQECALFSREESEIAETEMTDLLSEAVPTSSRLRPSTTTKGAVYVQTRRSVRIRQQSSRTRTTLSQAVQHVPRYLLKSDWSNNEDATTSNLIINNPEADKKATYKKTRRRKTD